MQRLWADGSFNASYISLRFEHDSLAKIMTRERAVAEERMMHNSHGGELSTRRADMQNTTAHYRPQHLDA